MRAHTKMTTEPNVLLCLKDSVPGARGQPEQLGLQNVSRPLAILLKPIMGAVGEEDSENRLVPR